MFAFFKSSTGSSRDRAAKSSSIPAATATQGNGNDAPRRLFWRAFLDWLAGASPEELEQLDRALEFFAPHVRPVAECMSEVIRDPLATATLPSGLVEALERSGWVELARSATPSPTRLPAASTPPMARFNA